jgi:hypothetical protein
MCNRKANMLSAKCCVVFFPFFSNFVCGTSAYFQPDQGPISNWQPPIFLARFVNTGLKTSHRVKFIVVDWKTTVSNSRHKNHTQVEFKAKSQQSGTPCTKVANT